VPTVLQIGPFRFFFYSSDGNEPEHIHVERDDNVAKFWLDPVRLERSGGFNRAQLRIIHDMVIEHRAELLEAWRDYFET
jgi:hypothetical protein